MDLNDGPETVDGTYLFGGQGYQLVATSANSWQVFDRGILLGEVIRTADPDGNPWSNYAARSVGDDAPDLPSTDDWRSAVEHLIAVASL